MPYNSLLLPQLGGFLFFHLAHYFRFGAQRLDGYRLLFQAAIAGTFLAFAARVIVVGSLLVFPMSSSLAAFWNTVAPFPYSGTSVLSLALGPILAWVLNLFISKEDAKDREIRKHGNALTKVLHRAQKESSLVSITLDSRKWYVGWVAESPNLDPQELYFQILPLTSGYRDKDDLEPVRTVFYEGALKEKAVNLNDLYITLPLRDVKIANLFNEDLYNDYFAAIERDPADPQPTHRHHSAATPGRG